MKAFASVLFLCAAFLALTPNASAQEYYSKRYDSLDVNLIFGSSRLLNNYVACLLDKKPCPPEGKDLKAVLPDALKTACGSCTQIQKEKALDVVTRLYYEHPDMYLALAERYDPSGVYTKRFEGWFDEQNVLKPRQPINREGNQFVTRNSQAGARRTQGTANSVQRTPNEIKTERTRIPSTWITSTTTTTTTTPRPRASRPTLRTLPPAARTSTRRVLPPEALTQTTTTFRPQTVSFIAPTTVRQVPIQRDPVIFREPPTIRTSTAPPATQPPIRTFPPAVVSQPSPVFVAPPVPQSFNGQDTRVQNPTTFQENPPSTRATTFAPPTTKIFPPTQQNSFNQQLPQFIPPLPTIREPPAVVRPPQETFIQPPRIPDFQQLPAFVPTTEPPTQRTFPPTFRPTTSFIPQTQPPTQRTFAPVQQNSFNQQTPQFVQSVPASDFRPQQETFVQPQQQPVFVPTTPPPTQRTFPPTFPQTQPPTTQRTIPPTFRTTQAPLPPVQPQTVNRPQPEVREPDAFRPQQNPERNQPPPPPPNFNPVDIIDNFFLPGQNGPFRRSIEQIMDTTGKVVNNFAGMVRSTIEVIAGTK